VNEHDEPLFVPLEWEDEPTRRSLAERVAWVIVAFAAFGAWAVLGLAVAGLVWLVGAI
jgi:fatty acid desaturase